MFVKLLGINTVDFVATNGEQIKGTNLFVSYPDENVTGERTDKFFVRPEIAIPGKIKIGEQISLSFNHRGRVEAVELIEIDNKK